jgi:hypothetical protein
LSNLSFDLAVSIKLAPRLEKSLAIARPIPDDAPVTSIFLFLNDIACSCSLNYYLMLFMIISINS